MSLVRNLINHRSPLQTKKSQPLGHRIMPETRLTSFPALSVYSRDGISRPAPGTHVRLHIWILGNSPSYKISCYPLLSMSVYINDCSSTTSDLHVCNMTDMCFKYFSSKLFSDYITDEEPKRELLFLLIVCIPNTQYLYSELTYIWY